MKFDSKTKSSKCVSEIVIDIIIDIVKHSFVGAAKDGRPIF